MSTSIVIVNYRSWGHLGRCLQSLLEPGGELPPGIEVLVVDNDSADGRLEAFAAEHPFARFLSNSGNHGFAHGCNLGAREARGESLLFLNPDVIASPAALAGLLAVKRRHPELAILSARQVDQHGRPQKAFDRFPGPWTSFSLVRAILRIVRPREFPDPRADHTELVECDWVSGSLLLIDAEQLAELGGWCDEYWMYSEDTDLCRSARDRGFRVAFTPEVEFVHLHGGASRQNPETTALTKSEVVKSKHVYVERHFAGTTRVTFHAVVALRRLVGLLPFALLDLLTLRRIPSIRARSRMLGILLRYHLQAIRGGCWISERSVRFPGQSPAAT